MKTAAKLCIGIGVLILLSPLGLLLPAYFKAGDGWGEWGVGTLQGLTGYIPEGLRKLSGLWKPPLPDYTFEGWREKGLLHLGIAYIFSAILGIAITVLIVIAIGKIFTKKDAKD